MNNLKIKIGIVILVIIIGGGIGIVLRSPKSNIEQMPRDVAIPSSSQKTYSINAYSLLEVSLHKNEQNCWTTINGNVYDLTSWIEKHPGGAKAILSLCGIDGTQKFLEMHGGQVKPEAVLGNFVIGKLK